MKLFRKLVGSLTLVVLLFALTHVQVYAGVSVDNASFTSVPGEIIVKYKRQLSADATTSIHKRFGAQLIKRSSKGNFDLVKLSGVQTVQAVLEQYKQDADVEYAEPNYIYKADYVYIAPPNDPYLTAQYGLYQIQALTAWQTEAGLLNRHRRIAILDTGVNAHEDIRMYNYSCVGSVCDMVDNDPYPYDEFGHGTHVAGIAGAIGNNGKGVAGSDPRVYIEPIRVLDAQGYGTNANIAEGVIYAADRSQIKVINLSLGGPAYSSTLENAINYAWGKGKVIIAAAGNNGNNLPHYPAAYANVIAVAAVEPNDQKAAFSSFGTWVDVAAPGVDIFSTFRDPAIDPAFYSSKQYGYMSGTSMAAPFVSGLAMLLESQGRNNVQIRDAILNTADPIQGTGTYWQYGRINAARAVGY